MKAVIYTQYGSPDVLEVKEVAKPLPKRNEVLIKIVAASVTAADAMIRKGSPFIGRLFMGLRRPNSPIPGTGFAGVVEALGSGVTQFNVGDDVFGESIFGSGTNAEYICVKETGIIMLVPDVLSYEEAAPLCDGALTSMNFLKNLAQLSNAPDNSKSIKRVLVNGASGSLGTAAIQLAKLFGAEVTGVTSTKNIKIVKSLGADRVIDYTNQDFTAGGYKYDVIYDTIGQSSFSDCKGVLTKNGAYISPVLSFGLLFQIVISSIFGNRKAKFSATGVLPVSELKELLLELHSIFSDSKIKSVMDKSFKLEQISEAHAYVDTGHKIGNVVLKI